MQGFCKKCNRTRAFRLDDRLWVKCESCGWKVLETAIQLYKKQKQTSP